MDGNVQPRYARACYPPELAAATREWVLEAKGKSAAPRRSVFQSAWREHTSAPGCARCVSDWGDVFGDPIVATAPLVQASSPRDRHSDHRVKATACASTPSLIRPAPQDRRIAEADPQVRPMLCGKLEGRIHFGLRRPRHALARRFEWSSVAPSDDEYPFASLRHAVVGGIDDVPDFAYLLMWRMPSTMRSRPSLLPA